MTVGGGSGAGCRDLPLMLKRRWPLTSRFVEGSAPTTGVDTARKGRLETMRMPGEEAGSLSRMVTATEAAAVASAVQRRRAVRIHPRMEAALEEESERGRGREGGRGGVGRRGR